MKGHIKHYKGRITVLGPLHIGCGIDYKKNEYIFDADTQTVSVMDIAKICANLDSVRLSSFENFITGKTKGINGLKSWFVQQQIPKETYMSWAKYTMQSGDSVVENNEGKQTYSDLKAFVKDPFDCPYVPGSSIKGMLRNALVVYELNKNNSAYQQSADIIKNALFKNNKETKGVLHTEIKKIEKQIFDEKKDYLKKEDSKEVNCTLRGLIVSDSKPLTADKLVLCKKHDFTLFGNDNPLPLFRECLCPGSEIEFDLTIDDTVCNYTIEDIKKALSESYKLLESKFLTKFAFDHKFDDSDGVKSYLGVSGFTSKTVLHALFSDPEEYLNNTDRVFKSHLTRMVTKIINEKEEKIPLYEEHHHDTDVEEGASPHILKLTVYNGKLYEFGAVKLSFE